MTATTPSPLTAAVALTDEMLARFAERAPLYDQERRFFTEDFLELRASGYLDLALPAEHGGAGLSVAEVGIQLRRLAYHAPATALGVVGHLYWTGMAADLLRADDSSCAWILERAAAGDVFAAGHGTATHAERVDGGWELTGRGIACGLAPVWDWLGVPALDTGDPPRVVHALLPRGAGGYCVEPAWDAAGMRAAQSDDIRLDCAFVADEHVALVGAALSPVTALAWAELGVADVHIGIAQRAFDVAAARARAGALVHRPAVRRRIAEMRLAVESGRMVVDRVDADWSAGVDHGADWPVKIVAARNAAAETARSVVDTAVELGDGSCCRLCLVDPGPSHELVATLCLGA